MVKTMAMPMVTLNPREVAMDEVWTVEAVAERFVDAARTARRLPRVAVQGYASTWPIVILPSDAYPGSAQGLPHGAPIAKRRGADA